MSDLEISIRGPEAAKMRFSCIQAQVCSYRILKAFVFPLLVSLTFLKELTQKRCLHVTLFLLSVTFGINYFTDRFFSSFGSWALGTTFHVAEGSPENGASQDHSQTYSPLSTEKNEKKLAGQRGWKVYFSQCQKKNSTGITDTFGSQQVSPGEAGCESFQGRLYWAPCPVKYLAVNYVTNVCQTLDFLSAALEYIFKLVSEIK